MKRVMLTLVGALLLSGCATEYKQVPTVTPADRVGSTVRFAQGQALMMSEGDAGTVWLFPERYYIGEKPFFQSAKLFFNIAAFNKLGRPINFGSEDVHITLEGGSELIPQDFDYLRHEAKVNANYDVAGALVVMGLEDWYASRVSRRDPSLAHAIYRRSVNDFFATQQAVDASMEDAIYKYATSALQTTTVDPMTAYGGTIYVDQFPVPRGTVRTLHIDVQFAGEHHPFTLRIAPEGTPAPIQPGLPAAESDYVQNRLSACQTWMWSAPAADCRPNATPVPPLPSMR